MMKRLAFAVFGALAGSVVACLLLLAGSHLLSLAGLRLYESESDQQRNFNLFLLAGWFLRSQARGWAGGSGSSRIWRRKPEPGATEEWCEVVGSHCGRIAR